MSAANTPEQIVVAADRLFYEQGFERTSFAHVAEAVGISRGNFYYHFKSKDEILRAVIGLRTERTRQMLAAWQQASAGPEECLASFVRMLVQNRAAISLHGCPVGSLCGELVRLRHPEHGAAAGLFTLFREWLAAQFAALGCQDECADALAMHLLARSQGVAALASAFRDERVLDGEVHLLNEWLRSRIAALRAGEDPGLGHHPRV